MKFIWEPKDIVCGRIVCKPKHQNSDSGGVFKPCGWSSKWTYKIGWLAAGNPEKDYYPIQGNTRKEREEYLETHRADYCGLAMTDGMVTRAMTKKEFAAWLNDEGMIPMPHAWFVNTIEYLRGINERGNGG